jgi:DNA-binding transcriptional regulator YiaG
LLLIEDISINGADSIRDTILDKLKSYLQEGPMGALETTIKTEIIRLARRELRKISVPMAHNVRCLERTISQIRKTILELQRLTAVQQKELKKKKVLLKATPEEVKKSRFSPRLIRSLRKQLGISQKELATLVGVTVGAVHMWESGKFMPKAEKKGVMVALRKLGREGVRKLLEERVTE